ncbi:uncharacterized protein B0I36DRAFT_388455 [Microdochium trichocladiopsis]|uniref:DUF2306 domain-containing protein n=1 Tax=Microdochium trichocladiopsis TaxID=1682393 RepID=A0A9P8XVP5_9PEZI|nr:uncharacterized protein B0I36DRAFT_388455 [Microdochium trichocladiopsis]KAH7018201.1 hypothetical protein B0I36DRAFT_388455 [Microdochium trichocladiopsis]
MALTDKPPRNTFVRVARKLYHPIGFSKGYNAALWFIFSGALFGFVLARFPSVNVLGVFCNPEAPSGAQAAPGECYYYLQDYYGTGMTLHLVGIFSASIFALVQFVPVIRHKYIMVHRISGYASILLSFVGVAGAIMTAPASFGGSLEIQAAAGFLGIIFVGSIVMAYINIKRLQIEQHRMWMLRAWFYATSIITLRIIFIIAATIISSRGPYFSSIPCAQIVFTIGEDLTRAEYPSCQPYFSGEDPSAHATVRASLTSPTNASEVGAAFNVSFGMAAWVAFAIHILGVEIYIKLTPAEHERLRQISYERQRKAGFRNPGRAGLTVDRFGDSERWVPVPKCGDDELAHPLRSHLGP